MQKKLLNYLFPLLFLAGVLMIVFIQFKSGKSIDRLIEGNAELLAELEFENQLQQMQTDVVNAENNIRGAIITLDSRHISRITNQIDELDKDLAILKRSYPKGIDVTQVTQLETLVRKKISFFNQVLLVFRNNGKKEAETLINTDDGRKLTEEIFLLVDAFDSKRQNELSRINTSISNNSRAAKNSGLILAALAVLVCVTAFLYIVNQSYRQRKLIEELDASEKKAREAARVKENFLANMSHEIRTPMNAILGFSRLLEESKQDEEQKKFTLSIKSSAENLLGIINDVLDISKIEAGMMRIEKVPFSLRELLSSVQLMFSDKVKEKGLQFSVSVEEPVPDILEGDGTRLMQVLVNLVGNAIKFTENGSVKIEVVEKDKTGTSLLLQFKVIDTGIGIPPDKQKKIFERFEQADNEMSRRYGGSGLGLSIVKKLVEIQEGKIELESEPGNGSVFKVELPYKSLLDLQTASAAITTHAPYIFSGGANILVAEDNSMNQLLLENWFRRWELKNEIVSNGNEAIKALEHQKFDLVLMDIQMPEMDGIEATHKIRHELGSAVPVIAMTALALPGEREKCLAAGMNDYVSKPLKEEELLHHISLFLTPNPGHSMPGNSMIDLDYLGTISGGNESFKKEMVTQFLMQVPQELNKIKTAIRETNYSVVRSVAHSMKTSVSFMGLLPFIEKDLLYFEDLQSDNEETPRRLYHLNIVLEKALSEASVISSVSI